MTHFGILAPPYLGHLNPMVALAQGLVARGHHATFFGLADAAALIADRSMPFDAVGAQSHPPGALARMTAHMAEPNGLGLFRIIADMASLTDMLCRELPAAFSDHGIDAIVTDQLEPAGGIVAQALGLPFVSVANALPINREPLMPPPFTGWNYKPSAYGLWRNTGGYRVADRLMRPMSRVIRFHADRFGLRPRTRLDECLSDTAEVSQMIAGLDFPRLHASSVMQACGPFRALDHDLDLDLDLDGRRLVFASLGSLQGGRIALFTRIAAACADQNMQLVIAHGGRLDPSAYAGLPGQPIVRSFVPQAAVLRHASLAITNGGLNTVLDALAAAVPLIVVPIAFEQGAIGARVARSGAGLVVPPHRLSTATIVRSIEIILANGAFRARAATLASEIKASGGLAKAVAIIESATGGSARQADPPLGTERGSKIMASA